MGLKLQGGSRPASLAAVGMLAFTLTACGGGGGGGSGSTTTSPGSGDAGAGNSGGGTVTPTASTYAQGTLIQKFNQTGIDFDDSYYALASGQQTKLPRSANSIAYRQPDQWYANQASGSTSDLVRVDHYGNVAFFDRRTLAQTAGGFSLSSLPGTVRPMFSSPVKPSPDGRYLLAYWMPDSDNNTPVIAVFDRSGNVVLDGSSLNYNTSLYADAADWLPDGRYIFAAGADFVIGTPGSAQDPTVTPLTLPAGTTGPTELSVSPDGSQIAAKLLGAFTNSQGNDISSGVLFITDLQGRNFRQLTTLSQHAASTTLTGMGHSNPVWSPDGKFIAFTVVYPQVGLGDSTPGCQPFNVVPADGQSIPIDGVSDPATMKFSVADLSGNPVAANACYEWTSWIATP